MTPQDTVTLCICGDPNCMIPYGLCHCGCGKETSVSKRTRLGRVAGLANKFYSGHRLTRLTRTPDGICVCGKGNCLIPYGLCHCGCGKKTKLATINFKLKNWKIGEPKKFLKGHTDKKRTKKHHLELGMCICGVIDCNIPRGLCHCGCGGRTPIARVSSVAGKRIAGEPTRFISGHGNKVTPVLEQEKPFEKDGVMCRLIPLTQGQFAIVNDTDYGWLMQWKWYTEISPDTKALYAARTEWLGEGKKQSVKMHRLILGLEKGDPLKGDHANGNSLDNRRKNLRLADDFGQAHNTRRSKRNISGYKGVSFRKKGKKWEAKIMVRRLTIPLGRYDTPEEAHAAYCEAARKYHGEFANFG